MFSCFLSLLAFLAKKEINAHCRLHFKHFSLPNLHSHDMQRQILLEFILLDSLFYSVFFAWLRYKGCIECNSIGSARFDFENEDVMESLISQKGGEKRE